MIEIKEVNDKDTLKAFVLFPFELYKGSRYWVPPLIAGEMKTFDPAHNPTLEFCQVQLILAYKQGRIVGRLALIVNRRENELLGQRKLRFGWLDFEDDPEITRALFDYATRWGREHGMEYMEGPVGFCNLDKAALLTEGFEELSNTTALYNYPYYERHLLACGLEHCTKWVEKEMIVPEQVPEKIRRFSTIIKERNELSVPDLRSKRAIRRYIPQVFDILNQTYCTLENFVPLTPGQQEFYAAKFMDVIHPDYVSCVEDKDGNMIAFGVAIPYMGTALQKAGRTPPALRLVPHPQGPSQQRPRRTAADRRPAQVAAQRRYGPYFRRDHAKIHRQPRRVRRNQPRTGTKHLRAGFLERIQKPPAQSTLDLPQTHRITPRPLR